MAEPKPSREITLLLRSWSDGHRESQEELWSLLYNELKTMARSALRRQGGKGKIGATSLVHEAFLRLLGNDVDWSDRRHFFAVASRAMRYVLIDEARRQLSSKRRQEVGEGTAFGDAEAPEVANAIESRPEEVMAIHQALGQLGKINPRHEQLVELRYFAGLTVEEAADVLGVTPRTVVRDWRAVRLFLHHALGSQESVALGP